MLRRKEVQISEERKKPLVNGNSTFLSSEDFRLTEEDLQKARRELNETEEKKTKYLIELKDRLAREKGLQSRLDDDYLLRFLRHAKFDCDKAYHKVLNFYAVRKKYPEIFVLTPKLEYLVNSRLVGYLPYRDAEGRAVGWIKFSKWDIDTISFVELTQLLSVIWDILSMNPSNLIHGIIAVWDFKGFTFRHAAKVLHPSNLRILMNILQDTYPWRVKSLILFHCNPLIQKVYRVMKPFIKTKMIERITFLGSELSELHQCINPVILEKEYGGSLESSELKSVQQHVLGNFPYLRYERSFGYV